MASTRSRGRDALFSSAVAPRPPPSFVDVVDGRTTNISEGDVVRETGDIKILFVFESGVIWKVVFIDKNGGESAETNMTIMCADGGRVLLENSRLLQLLTSNFTHNIPELFHTLAKSSKVPIVRDDIKLLTSQEWAVIEKEVRPEHGSRGNQVAVRR